MSLAWSSCTSSTKTCSVQDATLLGAVPAVVSSRSAATHARDSPERPDVEMSASDA
jgi:hypothetical protein